MSTLTLTLLLASECVFLAHAGFPWFGVRARQSRVALVTGLKLPPPLACPPNPKPNS